jgi:hypothetical protein
LMKNNNRPNIYHSFSRTFVVTHPTPESRNNNWPVSMFFNISFFYLLNTFLLILYY